jgi:hypothetical protein
MITVFMKRLEKWALALLLALGLLYILAALVWSRISDTEYSFYCHSVSSIVLVDETVYIRVIDVESNISYYSSRNHGEEWHRTRDVPQAIRGALSPTAQDYNQRFAPVCDLHLPEHCYRRPRENSQLEESVDGGDSWNIVDFPFSIAYPVGCWQPEVTGIVFLDTAPHTTGGVMVALGVGGIAAKRAGDRWTYKRVRVIMSGKS